MLAAIATVARLLKAYDGFVSEAFSAIGAVAALVGLNVVAMGFVIGILVGVLKPRNPAAYAVVVVLSWPVVVAAPIAVGTITGTEVPGKPESVKISDIFAPWEEWATDEIDEEVQAEKAEEIRALVTRWSTRGEAGIPDLIERLDESLADEGLSEEDIDKLKQDVRATLEATDEPFTQRLRQVARQLYVVDQRDVVKDLAAG